MKLYTSHNSPYARKVRVAAIELDVIDEFELVDVSPRDPATPLWSLNPLCKIPTLELADGTVLYDSPVICEYVVAGHPEMLASDGPTAFIQRRDIALVDGVIDAAMAARLEKARPANEQSAAWIEKQLEVTNRGFDAFETMAGSLGERFDLVAIAVACAVDWVGFRHPDIDWLASRPRLAQWHRTVSTRPSLAQTAPRE